MDAFANADELGKLLGRTFSESEKPHLTALLEAASTYLRDDVIGAQVWPAREVTFRAWPHLGEVAIPARYVRNVRVTTSDGIALAHTYQDDLTIRDIADTVPGRSVLVSYLDGLDAAPEGLKRWTMVLVSETLTTIAMKLGLGAGGISSLSIDDFRMAFADGGDAAGMQLSQRNIDLIRRQHGHGVTVVEAHR